MAETIHVKSPIRVDLSGGTIDCWPLCQIIPQATTINYALELFTKVDLTPRADQKVILESTDLHLRLEFDSLNSLLEEKNSKLYLYQVLFKEFRPKTGFTLVTSSESPVGAGLGGSSSLMISLIKAFSQWLNQTMSPLEMVTLACNLETQLLGKSAGTQDYFPALCGGVNRVEYLPKGPQWTLLDVNTDFLSQRALVVYTGRAHHSGLNNWDVIQRALNGDQQTLGALNEVAHISQEMYEVLTQNQQEKLLPLFERELRARLKLAPSFSSPEIERLMAVAQAHKGVVKICGAGGGGCVLILVSEASELQVLRSKVTEMGFRLLDPKPWRDPAWPKGK